MDPKDQVEDRAKDQAGIQGRPLCPRCENIALVRRRRRGIWQSLVLGRFGYFPWHCSLCRATYLLRQRTGTRIVSPSEQNTVHQPVESTPSSLPAAGATPNQGHAPDASPRMKASARENTVPGSRDYKKKA